MKTYKSEMKFVEDNIKTKEYRDKLTEIESELHNLATDLEEAKKEYLTNNGYVLLEIDGVEILASTSLSFQELHSSIQNMPTPDNQPEGYALDYLVPTEDIQEARQSRVYQDIVEERQNKIDEIFKLYKKFWNEEIKNKSNNTEQSIVYMMAGLNKNINYEKLSDITGISKSDCKGYTVNDDGVVIKT